MDLPAEKPLPQRRRFVIWTLAAVLLAGLLGITWIAVDEVQTSRRQAAWLSGLTVDLHYAVEPGASTQIRFPGAGPFDERLGYHQLPERVERLAGQGFGVAAQARMSPRMIELIDEGLFAAYREKTQAGLELRDCRGAAAGSGTLPRAHLRTLRIGADAAGRFTALHREPRTPRSTVSDAQPGGRVGPLRQGSGRPGAASLRPVARGRRRQHARHADREVPPFARRPHRLGARRSCARWPRRRCAPTSTARTRCRGGARSSSTTSTRCRCRPWPASARSTASATACGPGTAATSPT